MLVFSSGSHNLVVTLMARKFQVIELTFLQKILFFFVFLLSTVERTVDEFNLFSEESCFLGDNGESGLDRAIAVQLGDSSVVNVIVPMGLQVSVRFRVYSSLQPVTNPLSAEIEMLRNAERKLYDEMERQDHEMLRIEDILKDTLLSDGPNIITGEWTIVEVDGSRDCTITSTSQ